MINYYDSEFKENRFVWKGEKPGSSVDDAGTAGAGEKAGDAPRAGEAVSGAAAEAVESDAAKDRKDLQGAGEKLTEEQATEKAKEAVDKKDVDMVAIFSEEIAKVIPKEKQSLPKNLEFDVKALVAKLDAAITEDIYDTKVKQMGGLASILNKVDAKFHRKVVIAALAHQVDEAFHAAVYAEYPKLKGNEKNFKKITDIQYSIKMEGVSLKVEVDSMEEMVKKDKDFNKAYDELVEVKEDEAESSELEGESLREFQARSIMNHPWGQWLAMGKSKQEVMDALKEAPWIGFVLGVLGVPGFASGVDGFVGKLSDEWQAEVKQVQKNMKEFMKDKGFNREAFEKYVVENKDKSFGKGVHLNDDIRFGKDEEYSEMKIELPKAAKVQFGIGIDVLVRQEGAKGDPKKMKKLTKPGVYYVTNILPVGTEISKGAKVDLIENDGSAPEIDDADAEAAAADSVENPAGDDDGKKKEKAEEPKKKWFGARAWDAITGGASKEAKKKEDKVAKESGRDIGAE